jgi:hypothetical protein
LTGHRSINRRYAQLARELGLEVASVKPIGWSATTVPEPTAAAYASQLAELQAALVLWRRHEHRIGTGPRLPQPARLRLPVRPQASRRQGHVGRGTHPVRPLHATVRTRRTRGLTLNRLLQKAVDESLETCVATSAMKGEAVPGRLAPPLPSL